MDAILTEGFQCSHCGEEFEFESEADSCCHSGYREVYLCPDDSCGSEWSNPRDAYLCCRSVTFICDNCDEYWDNEEGAAECCPGRAEHIEEYKCGRCGCCYGSESDAEFCCTDTKLLHALNADVLRIEYDRRYLLDLVATASASALLDHVARLKVCETMIAEKRQKIKDLAARIEES